MIVDGLLVVCVIAGLAVSVGSGVGARRRPAPDVYEDAEVLEVLLPPIGGGSRSGASPVVPGRWGWAGRAASVEGRRAARPVRFTRRACWLLTAAVAAVPCALLWCFPYVVVSR